LLRLSRAMPLSKTPEGTIVASERPGIRGMSDKMRCPNAGAKDAGCGRHQSEAPLPNRFPRSDKEIYRGEAPENANQPGKHHKPDVVLLRDTAVKDFEHSAICRRHR